MIVSAISTPLKSPRIVRRAWLVWVSSLAVFTVLGTMMATQSFYLDRFEDMHPIFLVILRRSVFSFWIYGLLTPPVLWLCWRYPVERGHIPSRLLLHVVASLVFTLANTSLSFIPTPSQDRSLSASRKFLRRFLFFAFDNSVNTYLPIAVVGHMMLYYRRFRDRELRSAHLEGKLARAQLSVLKMQLQPHFLFNTLNAVSALTRDNPRAAEDMLVRLSDLLRETLDNDAEQEVPLRAELAFIGRYLEIEQIRFADRLQIAVEAAPDTLDALVPNMLLQPLVENAIRHGIARKTQSGRLQIRAWREATNLLISIQDTGPGFPANAPPVDGIGFSNTRSRLEHLHRDSHELRLENAKDGGAVVTLQIPYELKTLEPAEPEDEAVA